LISLTLWRLWSLGRLWLKIMRSIFSMSLDPGALIHHAVDPDLARQMTMNLRQLSFMNEALNWRRKSLR
jgi:hypothetical protein